MQYSDTFGTNRTGIQVSPQLSKAMIEGARTTVPPAGDEETLAELRSEYIADADPLGSVPLPDTHKSALKAPMELADEQRLFLDKLAERLAFERGGARLYEALITKCRAGNGVSAALPLETLQQFQEEEGAHFKMIAEAIASLGGDPTVQTPCADLVGVESAGLMQVMNDPRTSPAQCMHAMLVAELADREGWTLLIQLATRLGQTEMIEQFEQALEQELIHLESMRNWHEAAVMAGLSSS